MAPMTDPGLAAAIERAKTQEALSKVVGCSQQTISYRAKRGLKVPVEWVDKIESALGVPRHVLRPDVYAAPRRRRPAAQHLGAA